MMEAAKNSVSFLGFAAELWSCCFAFSYIIEHQISSLLLLRMYLCCTYCRCQNYNLYCITLQRSVKNTK